eukprot:scaffold57860_cov20-Tisochrysis_lutea.AAC.1
MQSAGPEQKECVSQYVRIKLEKIVKEWNQSEHGRNHLIRKRLWEYAELITLGWKRTSMRCLSELHLLVLKICGSIDSKWTLRRQPLQLQNLAARTALANAHGPNLERVRRIHGTGFCPEIATYVQGLGLLASVKRNTTGKPLDLLICREPPLNAYGFVWLAQPFVFSLASGGSGTRHLTAEMGLCLVCRSLD